MSQDWKKVNGMAGMLNIVYEIRVRTERRGRRGIRVVGEGYSKFLYILEIGECARGNYIFTAL